MKRDGYEVLIFDLQKSSPMSAMLYEGVSDENLSDIETLWRPELEVAAKKAKGQPGEEFLPIGDAHWDWNSKVQRNRDMLAISYFVIECEGKLQAIMQMETIAHRSKLDAGKEIAYVEFLSVAPWNRRFVSDNPRFKRCGSFLIAQAIGTSQELGFEGRIGLHSLPSASKWYGNLGMTTCGKDVAYENLEYFEFSSQAAATFLKGGSNV